AIGDPDRMPDDVVEHKDWELARDVASFANSPGGGYIVIGVADERKGRTIDGYILSDKLKSRIGAVIRARVSPVPVVDIAVVEVNGKLVTVLAVEEGAGDPCTVS